MSEPPEPLWQAMQAAEDEAELYRETPAIIRAVATWIRRQQMYDYGTIIPAVRMIMSQLEEEALKAEDMIETGQ
jgi:hypothetical protein